MVLGCGNKSQSVLPRFTVEGGEFALLTPPIKFFGAAIYPDLSLVEQSIIETGQIACQPFELPVLKFCSACVLAALHFCFDSGRRNTDQLRQREPVSRMRTAAARTDERSVGLGYSHCFRDLANFLASDQRLNFLNVIFLRQPARSLHGPPSTFPPRFPAFDGLIRPGRPFPPLRPPCRNRQPA